MIRTFRAGGTLDAAFAKACDADMATVFVQEDGILVIQFGNTVTAADLLQGAREIMALESQGDRAPHRLTDLSHVEEINLRFADMHEFASVRAKTTLKNPVKSAVVAPSPVQYGFGRMYELLNSNPRIELRVFRDRASALAWLGAP